MLAVTLLSLLALTASYEATLDQFQQWIFDHEKFYSTEAERAVRAVVWMDNARFVRAKNEEDTGTLYKMNRFGDMTHEEFKETLAPLTNEDITKARENMEQIAAIPPWLQDPASKDWRKQNAVTPVKNQGACGSCYAFSTTGALEGACAVATGKLTSFSEKQIMDCSWDYGNYGCSGGMFDRAFYYINKAGGIMSEGNYPYQPVESHTCKFNKNKVAGKVSNFYYVKQDEASLTTVVAQVGPVAIAINAGLRSFQFYSGGVYSDTSCDATLNHGVLAAGYGTEGGKPYYLVKNSWGAAWGEAGYIKMTRDGSNQCGIASYPSIPMC